MFVVCISPKAPDVQDLAKASMLSGLGCPDVVKLASLGASGNQPGNIHRDLLRMFKDSKSPEAYQVTCKFHVKGRTETSVEEHPCHMFLPHEWLACLSAAGISKTVLGLNNLQSFWATQDPLDPKLLNHPMLEKPGWKETAVPFLFHGDAAPFSKRDSLQVLSFRSILSELCTDDSQMLLAAVPEQCRVHDKNYEEDTMHPIWKALLWSFKALLDGRLGL